MDAHFQTFLEELPAPVQHCNLTDKITISEWAQVYRSGSHGDVLKGVYGDDTVCVRILKLSPLGDGSIKKLARWFRREMTAWLSLDHENVVKPHGWTLATEESKESIGFISAWCEEGDLHSYLRTHRPINRYELIRGISRGLTYLHERDVVHGDLKPCNIVMHNGIPKLWGYGLASIIDDRNTYAQESAAFTTLRYCAPELLNSDSGSRDKKTDVWAFGCTAGEVLYDKHPFQGIPISRLYAKLGVESPFDWDSQRYPDELKELVQGCLTRLPENRPSMESVRNALDSDFTARRRAQRRTRLLADLVEVQHCNLTGKIIIDEWDGRSYGNGFKGVYENDTVCVKTLKLPEDGSVTELARRFSREISVWLSLAHENVVKFHGWTLTGEGPICASLISAWSEGGNLKLHLKSQSINRYELIRGISRGLAYLHERDVVHGDLNPSNVVMHNGIPKLRDFGLFSIFDSSTTPALETSSLPYCAPELYNEKDLWDKQTDVWAFGCTAGEVLYNKDPFHGTPPRRIFSKILVESPFDWDSEPHPDGLKQLIQGCLARSPEHRPTMEFVLISLGSDFSARARTPEHIRDDGLETLGRRVLLE